jgi:hypothetical protein
MNKKLEKKLKDRQPTFLEEVAGLNVQQLEERLLNLAKGRQDIINAQEADEVLAEAKNAVKELLAPYRESLSLTDLKMRYLAELIKEKGGY